MVALVTITAICIVIFLIAGVIDGGASDQVLGYEPSCDWCGIPFPDGTDVQMVRVVGRHAYVCGVQCGMMMLDMSVEPDKR